MAIAVGIVTRVIGHHDLAMGQAFEGIRMPVGPGKTKGPAPVMHDQGHVFAYPQRLQRAVEIDQMFGNHVTARAAIGQLVGIPLPDIVQRDQTAEPFEVRHDIAPHIGRRGVPVHEDDGITFPFIHIGQPAAIHFEILLRVAHFRIDESHGLSGISGAHSSGIELAPE